MQIACAVLPSVACTALQYFFGIITQTARFSKKKKKLSNLQRVFWFSLQIFAWIISYSKKNSARYYHQCTETYPLFLSYFREAWIFSRDFRKYIQLSNFIKIIPVGASCFMREDGRTYTTNLTVAFLNFEKAPKDTPRCGSECRVRFQIWSATYFEAFRLGIGHKNIYKGKGHPIKCLCRYRE